MDANKSVHVILRLDMRAYLATWSASKSYMRVFVSIRSYESIHFVTSHILGTAHQCLLCFSSPPLLTHCAVLAPTTPSASKDSAHDARDAGSVQCVGTWRCAVALQRDGLGRVCAALRIENAPWALPLHRCKTAVLDGATDSAADSFAVRAIITFCAL